MSLPRRYRLYLQASRSQHVALVSELWWIFPPWFRVLLMARERGLRQAWCQFDEEVLIKQEEIEMGWFQKHVSGDPEKVAAFDAAEKAVNDNRDPDKHPELNEKAWQAAEQVPAPVRNGWW